MIQNGKLIIEVELAFTQHPDILLPNMEAMLRTYLIKEACNGHMIFERPKITLVSDKEQK